MTANSTIDAIRCKFTKKNSLSTTCNYTFCIVVRTIRITKIVTMWFFKTGIGSHESSSAATGIAFSFLSSKLVHAHLPLTIQGSGTRLSKELIQRLITFRYPFGPELYFFVTVTGPSNPAV